MNEAVGLGPSLSGKFTRGAIEMFCLVHEIPLNCWNTHYLLPSVPGHLHAPSHAGRHVKHGIYDSNGERLQAKDSRTAKTE